MQSGPLPVRLRHAKVRRVLGEKPVQFEMEVTGTSDWRVVSERQVAVEMIGEASTIHGTPRVVQPAMIQYVQQPQTVEVQQVVSYVEQPVSYMVPLPSPAAAPSRPRLSAAAPRTMMGTGSPDQSDEVAELKARLAKAEEDAEFVMREFEKEQRTHKNDMANAAAREAAAKAQVLQGLGFRV